MATDYTNPEMIGLERQRALAKALLQQGMETPQGQMISNRYVPVNPLEFLGNLGQVYAGNKLGQEADTKQMEMAKRLKGIGSIESEDVLTTLMGQQGRPELVQQGPTPTGGNIPVQPAMPTQAPNPMAALLKAQASQSPEGRAYIAPLLANAIPKKTEQQINYEAAKADGFKGSFTDYKNQMSDYQKAELDIQKKRLALEGSNANKPQIVETANGFAAVDARTGIAIPVTANGQPLMGNKGALTESQGKSTAFRSQMVGANNMLKTIQAEGFNPEDKRNQADINIAGGMGNIIASPAAQQYKQAQNQWTEAYLRFKTGAGTNASEVESNRKTYFPQLGDSPAVIAQKSQMREQAERDIGFAAGRGAQMGEQPNQQNNAPKRVVNFNDLK